VNQTSLVTPAAGAVPTRAVEAKPAEKSIAGAKPLVATLPAAKTNAGGKDKKPAAAAAATSAPPAVPARKRKEEPPPLPVQRRILSSGLQCEVTKVGQGGMAMLGKPVQVRYEGRLAKTGQRFDKGVIKFRLGVGEVIRGWDEGVKGMLTGERRRLLVPSRLGYGSRGCPPAIPRNADLMFEVELLAC